LPPKIDVLDKMTLFVPENFLTSKPETKYINLQTRYISFSYYTQSELNPIRLLMSKFKEISKHEIKGNVAFIFVNYGRKSVKVFNPELNFIKLFAVVSYGKLHFLKAAK